MKFAMGEEKTCFTHIGFSEVRAANIITFLITAVTVRGHKYAFK